jgi:pSer/pThr/pTyr-binding forkhead associated (FHA) protein
LRINDISVSRQHASIEMRGKEFYLYDNKSKFGTIVSEGEFVLTVERVKRGVQIGRTVMIFQLESNVVRKNSK